MVEIPTAVIVALAVYAALVAVGAVLLVSVVSTRLLAERRVRVARQETIGAHYLGLARSH